MAVDFFGRELLVLNVEGRPRAVMNVCMHLGGPLEWRDGRFVCEWHQAEFDVHGRQVKGPAKADSRLMFLPTRVEDGTLSTCTGRMKTRSSPHEGSSRQAFRE